MDFILTRRSIRKYTSRPVPEELVIQLLRAAMAAPSARNQQPWHFVVVRDRELLEAIAGSTPYSGMTRDAQLAVVVCGDLSIDKDSGFWVQDCSAATENLLIAANALELGAVWLGFYPREERVAFMRRLLGVPAHIIPFAVVPVGYPAEQPAPSDRFDARRIHLDRW
jgi:nitroreductase